MKNDFQFIVIAIIMYCIIITIPFSDLIFSYLADTSINRNMCYFLQLLLATEKYNHE